MAMIEEKCPNCGEVAEFSELYLGRSRTCPNCGKKMQVGEVQKEVKTIPWTKVLPAALSILAILFVIGFQVRALIPPHKDTDKAVLRCMNCGYVLKEAPRTVTPPTLCPKCGLLKVYYAMDKCANPKCGKINYFSDLSKPRLVCKYCGGIEFIPLEEDPAAKDKKAK